MWTEVDVDVSMFAVLVSGLTCLQVPAVGGYPCATVFVSELICPQVPVLSGYTCAAAFVSGLAYPQVPFLGGYLCSAAGWSVPLCSGPCTPWAEPSHIGQHGPLRREGSCTWPLLLLSLNPSPTHLPPLKKKNWFHFLQRGIFTGNFAFSYGVDRLAECAWISSCLCVGCIAHFPKQ